jgi:F-type H+-transporting ATPase subunit epsilon
MSKSLSLTIVTPLAVILKDAPAVSLRAEDDSGAFGILPGHADFLTVIDAGVLRWREDDRNWHYCALRGGVFAVTRGCDVHVACREATLSDDLPSLQARVAAMQSQRLEQARSFRSERTKLHARAIRHLMREFKGSGDTLGLDMEEEA